MGVQLSDLIDPEAKARLAAMLGQTKADEPVPAAVDDPPTDPAATPAIAEDTGGDAIDVDEVEDTTEAEADQARAELDALEPADATGPGEKKPGNLLDKPGVSNWVEKAGGLPAYIEEIAESLVVERGMPKEQAIPVAIGTVKRWARGGGDVTAKTRAKAAAAVAQWEALKARSGGKKDDGGELEVKATGKVEHKSDPIGGATQVLDADPETGRVKAIVSVTGIEDRVQDIIEPGAYTKSIAKQEPIGVWSHDDKTWVARADSYKELMPGDPFFKDLTLQDGSPWPREAGAVVVDARFNLDTPHGAAAFSDVKFFQGKTSWSIGYRATKATRNPRTGVRSIKELDWFEFSPVMVGANQHAMTLSVKSLAEPVDPDDSTGLLTDDERKKLPGFIKDKIEKRSDGDDKDDPKRKPHAFVGDGGLCKTCMAPKGAKVHTNTKDEKALGLSMAEREVLLALEAKAGRVLSGASASKILAAYEALGELLRTAGLLEGKALAEPEPEPEVEVDVELPAKEHTTVEVADADEVKDLFARGAELKAAVGPLEGTEDLAALMARRQEVVPPFSVKAAAAERSAGRPRARSGDDRRQQVKPVRAERRKAQRRAPAPAAAPAQGRVVRTEAGARRYGVAVGQVYTKEGAGDPKRGAAGEKTRAAQDALVKAGFLGEDSGKNKGRDGLFGPKTEAAVRAFQKATGLPVTGVLDKATASKLQDVAPEGDPPDGKLEKRKGDRRRSTAPKAPAGGDRRKAQRRLAPGEKLSDSKLPKARPGSKRVEEDEVPFKSPSGAKLVDYVGQGPGVAVYADGSVFDGSGWQKRGKKDADLVTERKGMTTLSEMELLVSRRLALDT